jgi:hypothetical protein
MRWHAISLIAAGAMIAVSVFLLFRPRHYTESPSTGLIDHQCAATPDHGLMAPEYTCDKQ